MSGGGILRADCPFQCTLEGGWGPCFTVVLCLTSVRGADTPGHRSGHHGTHLLFGVYC